MARDKVIIELQEQVRKLTRELEQLRGCTPTRRKGHHNQELHVSPIYFIYYSSHEDYDDKEIGL